MILLRNAIPADAAEIAELTAVPGFLNLRGGEEEVLQSIELSLDSFGDELKLLEEGKYIFVAEDIENKKILGVSMIAAKHGTLESPHFYFQVEEEEKYSQTIKKGFTHKTIEIKYETEGPSEIGGLVIHPEFRNTKERVGKQLSYVRFLYCGIHQNKFQKKIIAELLPPLNKAGKSPLWEAVGRRFTDMDYWEADLLCKQNKEFIFSLFPQEKIYLTFLSLEAQKAVGEVGEATKPAFHMLTKMGFKYLNQVDPFDGGPHLWVDVDQFFPVKNLKKVTLSFQNPKSTHQKASTQVSGLMTLNTKNKKHLFEAFFIEGNLINKNELVVSAEVKDKLENYSITQGSAVYFTPYY